MKRPAAVQTCLSRSRRLDGKWERTWLIILPKECVETGNQTQISDAFTSYMRSRFPKRPLDKPSTEVSVGNLRYIKRGAMWQQAVNASHDFKSLLLKIQAEELEGCERGVASSSVLPEGLGPVPVPPDGRPSPCYRTHSWKAFLAAFLAHWCGSARILGMAWC